MECAKASPAVRKGKKMNVKDELDRIKQAEKKKRRLEKALATSAAIRFELEKKKQKKKEEQQKLDEEGAAIAEAVALHVLVGEESDDSRELLLKKDKESNQWDLGRNSFSWVEKEPCFLIKTSQYIQLKEHSGYLGPTAMDAYGMSRKIPRGWCLLYLW